jgi:Protein of unknown function (DUF3990)
MILYHGSNQEIIKPNIEFSKKFLDFGPGFYLTSFKEQAEKWALRKATRQGGKPTINIYELSDNYESYNICRFETENELWLDFIFNCRKGELIYDKFDMVIGRVADDDVFKTIDMYFKNLWPKEKVLKELRYYKENDQICIISQQLIEKELVFIKSYEIMP